MGRKEPKIRLAFKVNRLQYEKKVVGRMIAIYCRAKHKTKEESLCINCQSLVDFCSSKLDKCPFEENKPVCKNCKVHCYKNTLQYNQIKEIMRFSGPRMLLHHPLDTLVHLWREISWKISEFNKKFA